MLEVLEKHSSFRGNTEINDDRFLLISTEDHGLFFIVADGLGGHGAGYRAAEIAINGLESSVKEYQRLSRPGDIFDFDQFAERTNKAIWQQQKDEPGLFGETRTTVLVLHVDADGGTARWSHCGDSRLYHIRDADIVHFTTDHTVAQMLVYDGELERADIPSHPDRNKLTRCFGGSANEARVRSISEPCILRPGDRFLLCTDGWWEYLSDPEIVQLSASFSGSQESLEIWFKDMEEIVHGRLKQGADDRTASVIGVNQV